MQTRVHPAARLARAAAGFVAVLTFVAGCSQLDSGQIWPWSTAKSEAPQPARMTVAWTHATETESGRQMRGFRGRVFFYPKDKTPAAGKSADGQLAEKDHGTPIKVDGTLTVYAFNVLPGGKLNAASPRKFLFQPEKLKKQCAESKQGPSYTVWLPWDTVGGPPQQVSLWTRFDGINRGAVVMSDHSAQLLPGVSQMPEVSKIAAGAKPITPQSTLTEGDGKPVIQTAYNKTPDEPAGQAVPPPPNHADSGTAASTTEWWK
jgi:hypothetical protein